MDVVLFLDAPVVWLGDEWFVVWVVVVWVVGGKLPGW